MTDSLRRPERVTYLVALDLPSGVTAEALRRLVAKAVQAIDIVGFEADSLDIRHHPTVRRDTPNEGWSAGSA